LLKVKEKGEPACCCRHNRKQHNLSEKENPEMNRVPLNMKKKERKIQDIFKQ